MFKELWNSFFDAAGKFNDDKFMEYVSSNPPKRMGMPETSMENVQLQPGKTLMILMGAHGSGKIEYAKKWQEQAEYISFGEKMIERCMKLRLIKQKNYEHITELYEELVLTAREKKDLVILDGNFASWVFRTTVLKVFEDEFDHIILMVFNRTFNQLIEAEKLESGVQEIAPGSKVYNTIYDEYQAYEAELENFPLLIAGVDKVYFESFSNLFF